MIPDYIDVLIRVINIVIENIQNKRYLYDRRLYVNVCIRYILSIIQNIREKKF